ncbi:MAG TPA: SPOR domain-containing protein [Methylophilus sp.]|uniref:SPOR domain-containing protein n=1 Tax=Methylophilus sp. TaxID=29541 RepID=UPI002CA2177A|nr:SPOR domain-containing protein [Methylophilus sp.]HSH85919.1 SPOR domain-containing protein [Methylophilus sp.]
MKRLFWILLLLNVVVFAYFKRDALSPEVSSLKPEIHPEQIKLLNASAVETYPKRTVAPAQDTSLIASPQPDEKTTSNASVPETNTDGKKEPVKTAETRPVVAGTCYEWSSFNTARVNEAVNLAQQLEIKTQVGQTVYGPENIRYWIYKPPMASAEAAQTKADELRKLGVEDFFIVQDDPKWRNAISFGVFRDEKLADKLMEDLKAKGVRLLIKSTRNGGQGQAAIKLQHVNAQQFATLQKSQSQFPDAVLKEIPCL